jgi:hypothetical protein
LLHFGNPKDLSQRVDAIERAQPREARGVEIPWRRRATWGERHPPDEDARRRGMLGNAKKAELRARRGAPGYERRMGSDRFYM